MMERTIAALAAMLVFGPIAWAQSQDGGPATAALAASSAQSSLSDADAKATIAALRQRVRELESVQAIQDGHENAASASLWSRTISKMQHLLPRTAAGWTWLVVGTVGEFVFFLRFVVQWWASERRKRTVVPMAFWHLSLIGTGLVLAYAIFRIDPVFILAYGLNIFLYVRNLMIARRQPELAVLMEKEAE